jgi:hypothetical protein
VTIGGSWLGSSAVEQVTLKSQRREGEIIQVEMSPLILRGIGVRWPFVETQSGTKKVVQLEQVTGAFGSGLNHNELPTKLLTTPAIEAGLPIRVGAWKSSLPC